MSGVLCEARQCGFSFSFENPVGAMEKKAVMQQFKVAPLRVVTVHHCAYAGVGDGWYRKPTHYFTNLSAKFWRPTGLTGCGRCGRSGSKKARRCIRGRLVKGKWKHFYTIGRESSKEFTGGRKSRKAAKNEIPSLQTEEIVQAAWEEWCTRQ